MGPNEYMKGKHCQTTTGLECVPERATDQLIRSVGNGKIVLSLVDLLPAAPTEETEHKATEAGGSQAGRDGRSDELKALMVAARRNLRSAEKVHT